MELREIRSGYKISQQEASAIVGMPLRTYIRYESDDNYGDELKRQMIINRIVDACEITEEKGLLTIEQIKTIACGLFDGSYKNEIEFCYLFGSYAKGYATEKSDVDLYVSTKLTGLRFVGLIERLRQALHKKVDLIRMDDRSPNVELMKEIIKDGIKIYG